MTKSASIRGEGGDHLQFAAADRFSVRSKLRDTKRSWPPLGPTHRDIVFGEWTLPLRARRLLARPRVVT
eukprot:scaffold50834_cov102-Phaeocystis_antarctica.AAC.1